jgi:hypothetical protein
VAAIARRVARLIEEPPPDTSTLEPKLKLIIDCAAAGLSPDVKAELIQGMTSTAASLRPTGASMDALRDMWRQSLSDFRILCLTESPAHVAMWYHYADKYRGVVLELRCDDRNDSAWLAAKGVTYPTGKPAIYTADGWAELITMRNDLGVAKMLDLATFAKAADWSYEREWRVSTTKRSTDSGDFTDYRFDAGDLGAVYLGPLINGANATAVLSLLSRFPNARPCKVAIGMDREFHFEWLG